MGSPPSDATVPDEGFGGGGRVPSRVARLGRGVWWGWSGTGSARRVRLGTRGCCALKISGGTSDVLPEPTRSRGDPLGMRMPQVEAGVGHSLRMGNTPTSAQGGVAHPGAQLESRGPQDLQSAAHEPPARHGCLGAPCLSLHSSLGREKKERDSPRRTVLGCNYCLGFALRIGVSLLLGKR